MSTVQPATRPMTATEFLDWVQRPENDDRFFELVRGEVIEFSMPVKIHGIVCLNVGARLGNFVFDRGTGYLTSNNAGVILARDPDTVRGPDIAYFEDAILSPNSSRDGARCRRASPSRFSPPATATPGSRRRSTTTSTAAWNGSG